MTPEDMKRAAVAVDSVNRGVSPSDADIKLILTAIRDALTGCLVIGPEFALAITRLQFYKLAFETLQSKRREEQRGYL